MQGKASGVLDYKIIFESNQWFSNLLLFFFKVCALRFSILLRIRMNRVVKVMRVIRIIIY